MNPIKSFLALTAILCVSTLYAEDNNTYIKQQVAYKDPGASGKKLKWNLHNSKKCYNFASGNKICTGCIIIAPSYNGRQGWSQYNLQLQGVKKYPLRLKSKWEI